jgi:hypothetical protein
VSNGLHNKDATVVEIPYYLRAAEELFRTEEREAIVALVSAEPECGDLIQGMGGFRKVRVGRGGMDKRAERESFIFCAMNCFLFF